MKENKLSRFREVMDSLGQGRRTEITLGDLFSLAHIFHQTPSDLLSSYGYEGPYLCQAGTILAEKRAPNQRSYVEGLRY